MVAPRSGETKQLVVLLHGYGSDGNDLIALAPYWQELLPDAMFVAPNAPNACDINPAGFQWFPLDLDREISRLTGNDIAGPVIAGFLNDLWQDTGLGPEDTLLVGFSQGAMMALDVGVRLEKPLMGIVAFSGGIVAPEQLGTIVQSKPPICLVHGAEDDVVPVGMSVVGCEALKKEGVAASLHISAGAGHTIAQDGLAAASTFIADIAKQA
jgi:phospholipase/carboxylesterase